MFTTVRNSGARSWPSAGLWQGCSNGQTRLEERLSENTSAPQRSNAARYRVGGVTYIDKALPFGLRSAPKIFSAIADALTWAMIQAGVHTVIHYLDDFFFCSSADSEECARSLSIATSLCERLNVPVAPEKVCGPATTLCFLGIKIDSRAQELRLPQEKLHRLKELLGQWSGRKVATKQQLQCLLGHLGHAARVVRPGRTFLRELIRTMSRPKHSYHKVRLNVQCKADIQWWNMFCHRWNGISFFQCNPPAPALEMFSDASGSWGCGAFVKGPQLFWFQLKWPDHWKKYPYHCQRISANHCWCSNLGTQMVQAAGSLCIRQYGCGSNTDKVVS